MFTCTNDFNHEMYSHLFQLLIKSGKAESDIYKFEALTDNNQRVLFVENLLVEHDLIPKFETFKQKKNVAASNLYRNAGNDFYKKRQFVEALDRYNMR